jgi:hypothetical protein
MYRTVVFTFSGNLDWQFDEDGEPTTPGGRELTTQITGLLSPAAAGITEVEQYEYYGWEFTCRLGKDEFHNVLNATDDGVYLTVQMRQYVVKKLIFQRPRDAFDNYCNVLGSALSRVAGVSNIRWEEYRT